MKGFTKALNKSIYTRLANTLPVLTGLGLVCKLVICRGGDYMTANQIAFNRYLEDARHNVVSEEIERKKALASARSAEAAGVSAHAASVQAGNALRSQYETERRNRVDESIRMGALEVERDKYGLEQKKLSETQRHNVAQEELNTASLAQQLKLGQAQIATNREVGLAQAAASQAHAQASLKQAEVAARTQQEQQRHNVVAESISRSQLENDAIRAQAAQKQAQASAATAGAARIQARVAQGLLDSEKFGNYARGFQNVTGGVKDITGMGMSILGGLIS